MLTRLLNVSGMELDDDQEIIEKEFLKMTKELEILSCFSDTKNEILKKHTPLSELRDDIISQSSDKKDVLLNSKSKNDDGFIVTKII